MFERFLVSFSPSGDLTPAEPWHDKFLLDVPGYTQLASRISGLSFGGGLLRFVSSGDGPAAQKAINSAFPEFSGRAIPFARDWLGRHFAIDVARTNAGDYDLLILEPGSGEVFEVDSNLENFLNVDVIDSSDVFLESELFELWNASGPPEVGPDQCVGFKVPLFLGGAGTIDNLELTDVQVYWELCGQLFAATKNLPPGTRIGGVERES